MMRFVVFCSGRLLLPCGGRGGCLFFFFFFFSRLDRLRRSSWALRTAPDCSAASHSTNKSAIFRSTSSSSSWSSSSLSLSFLGGDARPPRVAAAAAFMEECESSPVLVDCPVVDTPPFVIAAAAADDDDGTDVEDCREVAALAAGGRRTPAGGRPRSAPQEVTRPRWLCVERG